MLVQRNSMTEIPNVRVIFSKGESFVGDHPNGTYRVPGTQVVRSCETKRLKNCLPNTHEMNIHINTKRLFETSGLLPSGLVLATIHLVGEGDLLVVAGWEEADFVDPGLGFGMRKSVTRMEWNLHSSQGASCICAARKTKDINPITSLVCSQKPE